MSRENDFLLPVSSANATGSYLMMVFIVPVCLGPGSISVFFLLFVMQDSMKLHIQLERVRMIM